LWLRLTRDTFPPGVSPRLECLTASTIALVELARLNPWRIDLLGPSAWIIMWELVPDMSQWHRHINERLTEFGPRRARFSGGERHRGDIRPCLKGCAASLAIVRRRDLMPSQVKQIADGIMNRKKALRPPGRLEALHLALSSAGGLMRVFGSVVQAFMLSMLDAQTHVSASGAVGSKFVRDHDARDHGVLLQQLAQQALGGFAIPATLDQDVQNKAVLLATASAAFRQW
jgi:hypothetical protein